MNSSAFLKLSAILLPAFFLLLSGCAGTKSENVSTPQVTDSADLSCSYFYFLWGTHAEYEGKYEEAVDAYEKALICDPSARYISHKLPLLHLKKGDTGKAIELLEKNVATVPQDSASRMLLGRLLVQQKKMQEAADQYEAVLAYDPDNEQALLRLGVLLEQTGEPDRARRTLKELIGKNPSAYFGYLALARMSEQPDEALTYYLKALELNWSAELAYEIAQFHIDQHSYDAAINLLRQVLENDDSQEQASLLIVQSLLGLHREEEAIVELSLIPRYRNSPIQLSLALSKLYVRLGNHQQAIAHLQEILKADNDATTRYLLGVIYSDLEQFGESLEVLEGVEPEQEEFEDAVFLRAKILHQQGNIPEALAMLGNYMAITATRRPLFYNMAASLYQDSDKLELATEILEEGFRLYPENERILFDYGIQLERTKQQEKAISIMEKLLLVDPDHAEALNFVGYSWADSDRNLEKALAYISRAMDLKPGNGYIQDSLGWVHFKLGNFEKAREELLGALRLLPEDPYLHDHLGDVYRALKAKQKAISSYKSAIKYFDDQEKKDQVQRKIDALQKQ